MVYVDEGHCPNSTSFQSTISPFPTFVVFNRYCGLDWVLIMVFIVLQSLMFIIGLYCRGLFISSLHVLECIFHVRYKWVLANVSVTHGTFWRGGGEFIFVMEWRALYSMSWILIVFDDVVSFRVGAWLVLSWSPLCCYWHALSDYAVHASLRYVLNCIIHALEEILYLCFWWFMLIVGRLAYGHIEIPLTTERN